MAYEMKPGQGSAFRNERKTEDWHAEFRGKVVLPDGATHWLDVSRKKTAAGEEWLSVRIGKAVEGGRPSAHERAKANGYQGQRDEEIPF